VKPPCGAQRSNPHHGVAAAGEHVAYWSVPFQVAETIVDGRVPEALAESAAATATSGACEVSASTLRWHFVGESYTFKRHVAIAATEEGPQAR